VEHHNTPPHSQDKLIDYEDEVRRLKADISNKSRDINRLQARQKHVENQAQQAVQKYQQEINAQNMEIMYQREEMANMSKNMSILEAEQEEREQQLRRIQEGALRHLKTGKWMPQEDSFVRAELMKLEDSLRSWAKKYSTQQISDLAELHTTDKQRLVAALKGDMIARDWDSLVGMTAGLVKKRFPIIFTHAILAKYVFDDIFACPFFFLQSGSVSSMYPTFRETTDPTKANFGQELSALYAYMRTSQPFSPHFKCLTAANMP
jgi:DNA-directed RNA polymerase subunit F